MPVLPRAELQALLDVLGEQGGYAFAKGGDPWHVLERGGDWDLVVQQPSTSVSTATRHLGEPLRAVRRSYVTSLYYGWGEIDFVHGLQWRGQSLVSAHRCLAGARGSGLERRLRPAHQAVAGVLYPLLAHGTYKARYTSVWREAVHSDSDELLGIMQPLFGRIRSQQLVEGDPPRAGGDARQLRRALVSQVSRQPWPALRGLGRFACRELNLRWEQAGAPLSVTEDVARDLDESLQALRPAFYGTSQVGRWHWWSAATRRSHGLVPVRVVSAQHADVLDVEQALAHILRDSALGVQRALKIKQPRQNHQR